jgi:RAB protein geranylgeranyltransferase component A
MKKVFAVILTVALLMSLCVTAFAANTTGGSTEVSFNVDPTYTVTIPATVELNKVEEEGVVTYENDYTLTAEAGVRLKKNEYIEVTVASDFEMTTNEGATLAYTITAEETEVANDGIVAEFDTDKAAQTATIHIAAGDPDFAGEYKDTVTFTITVKAN